MARTENPEGSLPQPAGAFHLEAHKIAHKTDDLCYSSATYSGGAEMAAVGKWTAFEALSSRNCREIGQIVGLLQGRPDDEA